MNILDDLKYALRNIRATAGTSFLAVLIMAFGIGISMTMFAFVKGVLWNDMGFADEDRIVSVNWTPDLESGNTFPRRIRIDDYVDLEKDNRSFETLVGFVQHAPAFNFSGSTSYTEQYQACSVTPNFFDLLGVPALHGRTFEADDIKPGSEKMLVISYGLWQEKFGGDLDVFNRTGRIDGAPSRIVGIMPPEFSTFPANQRYWAAVDFPREWGPENPREKKHQLSVVGLLNEGISYEQAKADLESIASGLAQQHPKSNETLREVRVENYTSSMLDDQAKTLLHTLLACGVMVLFVACANVSNLMLARTARRSFELAIRNSLGASRAHVMYQLFLDGLLLTIIGGVCGLLIASLGSSYIWSVISQFQLPFWFSTEIDASAILVAVGAMFIAAILASFIPAWRCARRDSYALLRDDSRTSSSLFMGKLSKILVGLQIALALSLTIIATLMVTMQSTTSAQERIYEADKIVVATLWYGESTGFPDESHVYTFHREFRERMIAQGAQNVGFFKYGGLGDRGDDRPFELSGETYQNKAAMPEAGVNAVTPYYFDTYGFKNAVAGRLFDRTDTADSQPVAIVNRAFARTYYPNEDPIGKQIRVPNPNDNDAKWLEIVGVVENYVDAPIPGQPWSEYAIIYRPYKQDFFRYASIAAKFPNDGRKWKNAVRKELDALTPDSSPNEIRTVEELQAFNLLFMGLLVNLFIAFGIVSFLVASIGLYAVVSFSAVQRTCEFGIRMALGAEARDIIRSVIRPGLVQSILGLVLGLAIGQALTQVIAASMNITSLPPIWLTFGVGLVLIVGATAFSMLLPAFKAAKLDPVKALHHN